MTTKVPRNIISIWNNTWKLLQALRCFWQRLHLASCAVKYRRNSTSQAPESAVGPWRLFCILKGALARSPESRTRLCSCVSEAALWILHASWINRLWQLCAPELNRVYGNFCLQTFPSVASSSSCWCLSPPHPLDSSRFHPSGCFSSHSHDVFLFCSLSMCRWGTSSCKCSYYCFLLVMSWYWVTRKSRAARRHRLHDSLLNYTLFMNWTHSSGFCIIKSIHKL